MNAHDAIIERFDDIASQAEALWDARIPVTIDYAPSLWEIQVLVHAIPRSGLRKWIARARVLLLDTFGSKHNYTEAFIELSNHAGIEQEDLFLDLLAIFEAARDDYGKGYPLQLRQILVADVQKDFLDQASELLDKGYVVAACTLAGATLENSLRERCEVLGLPKSGRGIRAYRDQLVQNGALSTYERKQIEAWADLRNIAAHLDKQPLDGTDVGLMIDGIRNFMQEPN